MKTIQSKKVIFGIIVVTACCASRSWAENGVSRDEILLGETTNVTGLNPEHSIEIKKGSDLAFSLVNKTGGVYGRKFNVIAIDDAYDPKKAVENGRKLIDERQVFALFQIFGTPTSSAIIPLIEQKNVPLIAPITGAQFLRMPLKKNVFNIRVSYDQEAMEMVRVLAAKKIKKVAVVIQDDAFGEAGLSASQRALDHYGLKRVARGSYHRNTPDVEEALKEIAPSEPEAVLIWGTAIPAGNLVHAAIQKGLKAVFFGCSPQMVKEFIEAVGDEGEHEIYVTQAVPFFSDHPAKIVKSYIADAKSANLEPSAGGFEGYLNAQVTIAAFRKVGQVVTRNAFRLALERMSNEDFGGLSMKFSDKRHQGLEQVSFVQLKKRKFVPVDI